MDGTVFGKREWYEASRYNNTSRIRPPAFQLPNIYA